MEGRFNFFAGILGGIKFVAFLSFEVLKGIPESKSNMKLH